MDLESKLEKLQSETADLRARVDPPLSLQEQLWQAQAALQSKLDDIENIQKQLAQEKAKTQNAIIYSVMLPRDLSGMKCYKVYSVYNIWRYFERCDAHPWIKCSELELSALHTQVNLDDLLSAMLKARDGCIYILIPNAVSVQGVAQ
jgi:hypothetical protein